MLSVVLSVPIHPRQCLTLLVVCDTDVGRLQREIQDLGGNLVECTADIDIAREERTRLAEQLRSTVEETVDGDLIDLLSLFTRRKP
jgi:hypothetical protein